MKQRFSKEKIQYWFDCLMSRGPIAMTMLLAAVTLLTVGVIGIIACFVSDDGGLFYQLWMSLMHTLDPGTLAGNATDNVLYVFLMTLATLCGLFLTSILIGIISTGVEEKLADLRKGTSVVQETGHTVIIGFDNDIYTLLQELIEANSNHSKACIVVLGQQPKEEMEDAIAARFPDTRTTQIICRSGKLHESFVLQRCAVENCRSVIINVDDDAETIKILLALSAYARGKKLLYPELRFVTAMDDVQYLEAASIAGEGRAQIIYAKSAIARIISNTCRQHGLSQVLTELFDFSGDELYFEQVPQLTGKTFREACLSFNNATVFGLFANGQAKLNPPMDTVITKDDRVILLEADDGDFRYRDIPQVDVGKIVCENTGFGQNNHLLVLGSNDKLPMILTEYNLYVTPGSQVIIVDDELTDELTGELTGKFPNLQIRTCREPVTRALLLELLQQNIQNILLLNDDSLELEASDAQTLVRLILLRDIADKTGKHFSITTEMRSVDNQRLASQARVDDFVIGSNFASLLVAQISENPDLAPVVDDLLDESGSELYMKSAAGYVAIGEEVNGYILTESAARRGEIYVGYRHMAQPNTPVVVNPNKDEPITFGPDDLLILIAED